MRGLISPFAWSNLFVAVCANHFGIKMSWQIGGVISRMPWSNFCPTGTGALLVWENVDQTSMHAYTRVYTHTYTRMSCCAAHSVVAFRSRVVLCCEISRVLRISCCAAQSVVAFGCRFVPCCAMGSVF